MIADQAIAAAALQTGDVDWMNTLGSDLLPLLGRDRALAVAYTDDSAAYILRFNHLSILAASVRLDPS